MPSINPEELIESEGVSPKQREYRKSTALELLIRQYRAGYDNKTKEAGFLHFPDSSATLTDIARRCKKNYPDAGVFESFKTASPHDYMMYNDQKAYNKAYFVPYLQIIEKGAGEAGKKLLIKDIRRNIQDETGIKQNIERNPGEDVYPLCPVGEKISLYYPVYEVEAHSLRRKDSHNGKRKLYADRCKQNNETLYIYTNPESQKDPLHNGTILHILFTQELLHKKKLQKQREHLRLNCLGRIYFQEHTIPVEFTQSLRLGKRLFPHMDKKTSHYESDHIIHDAGAHAKRLDEAIHDAGFTDNEYEKVKEGIYEMFLIKAMFYQGHAEANEHLGNIG